MRGWYAVFSKEMANFFVSPIAYVVIVMFLALSGFFFFANISYMSIRSLQAANNPMLAQYLNLHTMVVQPLLGNMGVVLLLVAPLITMRLFAEEKRSGTIELLLTFPITDSGVLAGKFLAAVCLLLVMVAGTGTFPLILGSVGNPDWGPLLSGYLGLILMGGAFIALGMFISSLTENQIIAGMVSFGVALMFWIISWLVPLVEGSAGTVVRQVSILAHLDAFNKGIISLSDLFYFILFIAFFLFVTLRSLETHRWRG